MCARQIACLVNQNRGAIQSAPLFLDDADGQKDIVLPGDFFEEIELSRRNGDGRIVVFGKPFPTCEMKERMRQLIKRKVWVWRPLIPRGSLAPIVTSKA